MTEDDVKELQEAELAMQYLQRVRDVRAKRRELIAGAVTDTVRDFILALLKLIDDLGVVSKALGWGKDKKKPPPKDQGKTKEMA